MPYEPAEHVERGDRDAELDGDHCNPTRVCSKMRNGSSHPLHSRGSPLAAVRYSCTVQNSDPSGDGIAAPQCGHPISTVVATDVATASALRPMLEFYSTATLHGAHVPLA